LAARHPARPARVHPAERSNADSIESLRETVFEISVVNSGYVGSDVAVRVGRTRRTATRSTRTRVLRRGYHEGLNSRRSDGRRKAALTDADRFEISPRPSDHLRKALEGHPSPWGTFSPFVPSV